MKKLWCIMAGSLLLSSVAVLGAESIGLVVSLQGMASAKELAASSRPLRLKSDLFLNDCVTTGVATKLQVLFDDDSIFSQGENSEMTIDEYVYSPAKKSENAFGVKVGLGIFRTVSGKITELNPTRFHVKTKRATIGIRGCDVGVISTDHDVIIISSIGPGRSILIETTPGGKTLKVKKPLVVVVDAAGNITTRPLLASDRSLLAGKTTPTERRTGSSVADSPAPDGKLPQHLGVGASPKFAALYFVDDLADKQSQDQVLDEVEGQLDGGLVPIGSHLLSASELGTVATGTYSLTGTGSASATVAGTGFGPDGLDLYASTVDGPMTISLEVGSGILAMNSVATLSNTEGDSLTVHANSYDFSGGASVMLDEAWVENVQLDGDAFSQNVESSVLVGQLYGVDGDSAPTAADVNGTLIIGDSYSVSKMAKVQLTTDPIGIK